MHKIDSHNNDGTEREKRSPFEKIIYRQQENSTHSDPAEKDSYDEFCEGMTRLGRRIKRLWKRNIVKGWRQTKFHEKVNVWIAIVGLAALIVYTAYTIKMYKANRVAAEAAESAAETARDALVIGNRPWIKVDIWQTAPLEFLPDGSARMGIKEKIENIGPSVALRVKSWFNIFPLGSTSNTFLDVKARQKEGCDAIRFPKTTILEGEEIFPHDPMLFSYDQPISKGQIIPIKDTALGLGGQVGQVGFILAGCVTYRSSFEYQSVPSHETLFEYWIAKPAPKGGVIPFLDPVGTHPDYSIFRLQNGLEAN